MSNRTLVELNHDFCPRDTDTELLKWAKAMRLYMGSADPKLLPYGVTFKHMRHHSEPEPLTELRAKLADAENRHAQFMVAGGPVVMASDFDKERKLREAAEAELAALREREREGRTVIPTGDALEAYNAGYAAGKQHGK